MVELLKKIMTQPDTLLFFMIFMIPIVAIICGSIVGVAQMVIKHRERMEMIRQGIHPDDLPDDDDEDEQ